MARRESLGELLKAVETLAYGSCFHGISRSPELGFFTSRDSRMLFKYVARSHAYGLNQQ